MKWMLQLFVVAAPKTASDIAGKLSTYRALLDYFSERYNQGQQRRYNNELQQHRQRVASKYKAQLIEHAKRLPSISYNPVEKSSSKSILAKLKRRTF